MTKLNRTFLFGLFALLLTGGTVAAQKITTTADKSYDFKNAKRYAWAKNRLFTKQSRESNAFIDKKIVEEVNRNLVAKGFVEDPAKPDFYISYDAGSTDPMIAVEGATSDPPTISTSSVGPVYGIQENVWYSVNGHIGFRIVDAASKKTVWTVDAAKKIRDPQKGIKNMPKAIEQLVAKSFKDFPPRAK